MPEARRRLQLSRENPPFLCLLVLPEQSPRDSGAAHHPWRAQSFRAGSRPTSPSSFLRHPRGDVLPALWESLSPTKMAPEINHHIPHGPCVGWT